ncbi:MAG: hypothetical protein FWD05_00175 [Oscillospiraceae bacterium]|nr:hypothetical protein [Oscillospiraceae bacterium]
MDLWQIQAAEKMTDLVNIYTDIDSIEFSGSMLDYSLLDVFSDVDMIIHLSDNAIFELNEWLDVMAKSICDIFGYELYENDNQCVIRVCFENGWRFDMTFINATKKSTHFVEDSFENKVGSIVNQFWFISVMVLIKLGRNDYLTAAHLALELMQLNIVIQMLVRDEKKKTNIHRFGDREDVSTTRSLNLTNESSNKDAILTILYHASEKMDELSASIVNSVSRTDKLRRIHEVHL